MFKLVIYSTGFCFLCNLFNFLVSDWSKLIPCFWLVEIAYKLPAWPGWLGGMLSDVPLTGHIDNTQDNIQHKLRMAENNIVIINNSEMIYISPEWRIQIKIYKMSFKQFQMAQNFLNSFIIGYDRVICCVP